MSAPRSGPAKYWDIGSSGFGIGACEVVEVWGPGGRG